MKHKFGILVIIPILFITCLVAYYAFEENQKYESTNVSVDYIAERFNGSGKLVDYFNEVSVNSVDDILFYELKNGDIKIQYGKHQLLWTRETFLTQETQDNIARIGLSSEINEETGKIVIYWGEEEVERRVSN